MALGGKRNGCNIADWEKRIYLQLLLGHLIVCLLPRSEGDYYYAFLAVTRAPEDRSRVVGVWAVRCGVRREPGELQEYRPSGTPLCPPTGHLTGTYPGNHTGSAR